MEANIIVVKMSWRTGKPQLLSSMAGSVNWHKMFHNQFTELLKQGYRCVGIDFFASGFKDPDKPAWMT